jgi:hypothetical protein
MTVPIAPQPIRRTCPLVDRMVSGSGPPEPRGEIIPPPGGRREGPVYVAYIVFQLIVSSSVDPIGVW